MKSFSSFLESQKPKTLYFTFGRFNPPTKGHGEMLDYLASVAGGNDYMIYPSPNEKGPKNPLKFKDKVKFMRKMFPHHARRISEDPKMNTAFTILANAYKNGYGAVYFVVGADRVGEFTKLLSKYNGVEVKDPSKYYNFETLKVVPSGARTKGVSGTDLRNFAVEGDYESFKRVLPAGFKDGRALFVKVREGLGIKESFHFGVKFESTKDDLEEKRSAYLAKEIFQKGAKVQTEKTDGDENIYTVAECKTNHIVTECGKKFFIADLKEV